MNTTMQGTLEAPRSHVRAVDRQFVRSLSRSTLADRLALRLGLALVLWSRQHDVRSDARRAAHSLRLEREERRAGQFADERRAMAGWSPR